MSKVLKRSEGQYRGKLRKYKNETMKITKKQKTIIYGLILGDGYLQKTGKKNSRLRLEHSAKQKDYILWKYNQLKNIFADKPKKIVRTHPSNGKQYSYYRLQSNSSPLFGKLQKLFYKNGKKIIPDNIEKNLNFGLTLAVWFMDDGYYYQRDKSAHIYLPQISKSDQNKLLKCLKNNFQLSGKIYCRPDKKSCQVNFTGKDKEKLFKIINPYVISSLKYKLPLTP